MIDNFSLAVTHGLMLIAAFLLLRRPDLDQETGAQDAQDAQVSSRKRRWGKRGA
ncbi:hypothetical protein LQ953_08255 [Sphingomonas sp. IC-56]|uniref:hypothetical protein n=1 Tax=Sphingomonas sp. IC-56 TaxID=2898529 RepID=UPI001E553CF5|nr:hypothetical protein [Sphingomonas sp. IC-56]MCD2324000.1 hypothetical protein [Sphingomonas sp. IC-56]